MKLTIYVMSMFILYGSSLFAQLTKTIKYERIAEIIDRNPDNLTIVNFWATWCAPCVEEIPHFVKVFEENKAQANLDMIFVSLDRVSNLNEVNRFAKKHRMPGTLLLLDDAKRLNEWIPKIHPDWEGNLPATGFYRNGKLLEFHPTELSEEELVQIIEKLKKSSNID